MKAWIDPTRTGVLQLPQLEAPPFNAMKATLPHLSIPVSASFLTAWTEKRDPNDENRLKIDIQIIGTALCKLIKKGQKGIRYTTKENPDDVVTEMDQGIEMLLRLWIHTHYPEHKIIGEEGEKDQINTRDYVWYLDPIDGTANFIKGSPDVAVHIACIQNGHPIVYFVGLPFKPIFYAPSKPHIPKHRLPEKLTIGTEYLPNRGVDEPLLKSLIKEIACETHQVKSIGIHILDLLNGHVTAFFKSGSKLWDFMAPLAALDDYQPGKWNIEILIKTEIPQSSDAWISLSPFSNKDHYIQFQNKKHTENCRIGTIIITPKSKPELRTLLIQKLAPEGIHHE